MATQYPCFWIGSICIVWFIFLPLLLLLLLLCYCCYKARRKSKRSTEVIEVQYDTREELEWSIFIQEWAARFIACATSIESWNLIQTEDEARSIIFSDEFQKYFEDELRARKLLLYKDESVADNAGLRRRLIGTEETDGGQESMTSNGSNRAESSSKLPWSSSLSRFDGKDRKRVTILNAAEMAVTRIADERDKVQQKTFTKWINKHLLKSRRQVDNLYEDLRDGNNLIALLEVLSGETLPREKGNMRFHRLQNVEIALNFLRTRKLKLVNIRNDDITDGNPKLTLGLIWTLILHFQIEDIAVEGEEDLSARNALLLWAQRNMEGYDDIRVVNFTSSWTDGKALNAIIHRNRPDLIDMDRVRKSDNKTNLVNAFSVAEKELGVTQLLDAEDVDVVKPDERSLITYVSSLYDVFPKVPPFPISITVEEWRFTWEEYLILVTSILEWIQKRIVVLRKRDDVPCSTVSDVKDLLREMERLQEEEFPAKEADKNLVGPKFDDLETMTRESLGRFQIPPGHEPAKVESAWADLIAAYNERKDILTAELKRLEKLHTLSLKITAESTACRTKLEEAEKLIKIVISKGDDSDGMRRNIEGILNGCEKDIKGLFVNVQTLKDERYRQADDLHKTVFLVHEKLTALRSSYTTALKEAPNVRAAILAKLKPKLESTEEYMSLQIALKWVAQKTDETEAFPLGNDQPTAETQQERVKVLEKEVNNYQSEVQKCQKGKDVYDEGSDDKRKYTLELSRLDTNYSNLRSAVVSRESHVVSLLKFLREATQLLAWMSGIEKEETNRDLTDYLDDVTPLEERLERLRDDIDARDSSFNSTVCDGQRLVNEGHPAQITIRTYVTNLTDQWEWISSLRLCLLQHVEILNLYMQFHSDCAGAEKLLRDQELDLQDKMREISTDAPAERAEQVFRLILEMKEDLEKFKPTVADLVVRSKNIPRVEDRPLPLPKDTTKPTVTALCSYRHTDLPIAKGEECIVLATPQLTKWTVQNTVGQSGDAPSAIFSLPPPSTKSIARAQALDRNYVAVLELWREHHARAQLVIVIIRLQESIKAVMSWTIESYRIMSPSDRQKALKVLKDGMKSVEETGSDDPSRTVKVAALRVDVQRCLKHAEGMAKQLEQGVRDEENCHNYISKLTAILRRLDTIDGVVSVRVKTTLPRDVASVQHVINDHESTVVELKTIQPQYVELRDGSKVMLEDNGCATPSKEELGTQLVAVEKKWNRTWNVSTAYFEKLKIVYLVLQSTDAAEKAVASVETKIEDNKEIPLDSDGLKKQQIVFRSLRDALEQSEPIISSLQRDADQAHDVGVQLVKVMHAHSTDESPSVTVDVDAEKYTANVKGITDRWQACKVFVQARLVKLKELLPKAEQGEAEEQRTRSLIERLEKLLATLIGIETSQEAQIAVWLPRSVPALEQAEESQGTVVKRVEDLKPEYDSVQTVVVNFINDTATGGAPSLALLRENLHKVQGKWAEVWLVTHVYFEKIKGLLYTQSAIIECEKTVVQYEKILTDRSHPTTDVDTLRIRNEVFQKLAAEIPIQDSNFDALAKNFASTKDVAGQLPAPLAEKCNADLDAYFDDADKLQRRWDEAKARLRAIADEVKIQLPKMEKAAAQDAILSDLLARIRALSSALATLSQSQTARMQVALPTETMGLEKCLATQKDVQNRLADLSSDYDGLIKEVSNVLQLDDLCSSSAETVRHESNSMTETWESLNQTTGLFYSEIKVLCDVSKLMHDVTVVVTKYEQTLDANEHVPENDLLALRKQEAVFKALADEIPAHDPKFFDVAESLDVADTTARKLADASGVAQQDNPQRQKALEDLEERWEAAKKRIRERLELLAGRIPLVEKTASEEGTAASVLPNVEAMIRELECLESAQIARADVMLPTDESSISRVTQQQKSTLSQFQDDVTSRYDVILAQCRPLVAKKDSKAPSVVRLCSALIKMEEKYDVVRVLLEQYLIKVQLILQLVERLVVVRPVLKKYEAEVSKAKPNSSMRLTELKAQLQVLLDLKARIPMENPKFEAVSGALREAEDNERKSLVKEDQDLAAHAKECGDVAVRWETVLKELDANLAEVEVMIPNAEKAASVESKCEELLPSLRELIAELDSIEHTTRARISLCLPADPESVDKAVAQQKDTSDRLDRLEPTFQKLKDEVAVLLNSIDEDTSSTKRLRDEQKVADDKWELVQLLCRLYFEKLRCLCDAAEKTKICRCTVHDIKARLVSLDSMSCDVPGLKEQVVVLEKMESEIPAREPEFDGLAGAVTALEKRSCELEKDCSAEDLDTPQYQEISRDLVERWKEAKDQIGQRLECIRIGLAKLSEYEQTVEKQKEHLDRTTCELDKDDLCKIKPESKGIAWQIEEHKKISDEIDGQKASLDKLLTTATEFDGTTTKFADVAAKFVPRDADLVATKKEREITITRVIVVEVTTITLEYDKLKNLISERVDRYTIECNKAKDKEEMYISLQSRLEKFEEVVAEREQTIAHVDSDDRCDDLDALERLLEEQKALVRSISLEKKDIDENCTDASQFMEEVRCSFPQQKSRTIADLAKSVQSRCDDLANAATAKLKDLEDAYDRAKRNEAKEKERFLADILQIQAEYEASLSDVCPWLDDMEKRMKYVSDKTLPVEQKALQVLEQEIEELLKDVSRRDQAVKRLENAACDVINFSREAIEDEKMRDIKNISASTRKRYDGLRSAAERKLTELTISEKTKSFRIFLDSMELELKKNQQVTFAQFSKTVATREDAEVIKAKLQSREPDMADIKAACSTLVEGGSDRGMDLLFEDVIQLSDRFIQFCAAVTRRCDDLEELSAKVATFEDKSAEILGWIESTLAKLDDGDVFELSVGDSPEAEEKIKNVKAEVKEKRPVIDETLREGESIVEDRRVTDSSSVRDVISRLRNLWEDLLDVLLEMEEGLSARREKVKSSEYSKEEYKVWMKSIVDTVGDMRHSIVLQTLSEQIEKSQELLDRCEIRTKDLDRLCDGSAKEVHPARKPLRTYKRKREKCVPESVQSKQKGTDCNLDDTGSMLGDLSERISDKRDDLMGIKKTREGLDEQVILLESLLREAEAQNEGWQRVLDSPEPSEIHDVKKMLACQRNLREDLLLHTIELQGATKVCSDLCELKPNAEGVPEMRSQIKDINDRWNAVLVALDSCVSKFESNLGSLGDFSAKESHLRKRIADERNTFDMLGPVVCDHAVLTTQAQQVGHSSNGVLAMKPQVLDLLEVAKTLPNAVEAQKEASDVEIQWTELKNDLESRKSTIDDLTNKLKEFERLCGEVCEWSEGFISDISQRQKLSSNPDDFRLEESELAKIRGSQFEPNERKVERCKKCVDELIADTSDQTDTIALVGNFQTAKKALETARSYLANCNEKGNFPLKQCEDKGEADAHTALAQWVDSNEAALREIGFDVSAICDAGHTLSIRDDNLKNLDDFIQKIHPEGCYFLSEPTKRDECVVADDMSRISALRSALHRHLTAEKPEEKLAAFVDRAIALEKDLGDLAARLNDLVMTSLDPERLKTMTEIQKRINDEIKSCRGRLDGIVEEGETLAALDNNRTKTADIKKRTDALETELDSISQKFKSSRIERFLPMAQSFVKARDNLMPWIRNAQSLLEDFKPPAILSDDLKAQQEEAKAFRSDVAANRSLVDKVNKVGTHLLQILAVDNPSLTSNVTLCVDDVKKRYAAVREETNRRAVTLENALEEANQFFGRIKSLCDQLSNAQQSILNLPPVTIEADEIKERVGKIKFHEAQMGKLSPTYNSIKAQGGMLLKRTDGVAVDASKRVVEDRLSAMETAWEALGKLIIAVLRELNELLNSCQRFWDSAESLNSLIRELGTIIDRDVGEPSVGLAAIRQQIEVLEALCEKMSDLEKNLGAVREEAIALCSLNESAVRTDHSQRTMEVKKIEDELNTAWNELQSNVSKTSSKLEEALNEAVCFQEAVQGTMDLLMESHEKVKNLSSVATELTAVKAQVEELKELKKEAQSHQMELERLCHRGEVMAARAEDESANSLLRTSVSRMRDAWKGLSEKIVTRQHALQIAMLALGQLHHAIEELAEWLAKTERQLDSEQPPPVDVPERVKIEMAKHKILWNEISAHKVTLDSLAYAAHELSRTTADVESIPAHKEDSLTAETDRLTSQWEEVNAKAEARQWELEDCLEKAEAQQREIDLLSRWLGSRENGKNQTLPFGGFPETALEHLNAHKILMGELDQKKEILDKLLSSDSAGTSVEVGPLQERLKVIEAEMLQRKAKLQDALELARKFHDNMQSFTRWLTDVEKVLNCQKPPSVVMETLGGQLEKQKVFESDISFHCDTLLDLEQRASHLVRFSQKQDAVLVKNLLSPVRARWTKVNTKLSERSHLLNESHKKACQFYESWEKLCGWLDSANQNLNENYALISDPDKVKILLDDHKEFQRTFASRRIDYDAVTVSGKFLREKGQTYRDKSHVDEKLKRLKEKWESARGRASKRQNELEHALMTSGRLKDAIDSLQDWFYDVEPLVSADASVLGDTHTVSNLIDQHNALLAEVKTREGVVRSLQVASAESAESANSSWVKGQTEELSRKWDALCKSAGVKEARLASAKFQAEEFQLSTQDIMDWLSASEASLSLDQQLPDDEFLLQELKAADQEFEVESEKKKKEVESTLALGNAILSHAHPVAIAPIKHWLAVLQSRWEEVEAWAKQRGEQVVAALDEMEAMGALWEQLMNWLKNTESAMDISDDQPMPEKVEEIEKHMAEHQTFQDEMLKRQPYYDKLTNTSKRRLAPSGALKRQNSSDDLSGLQLQNKWKRLWLKVLDRQQRLQNAHDVAKQRSSTGDLSFEKWRSRYMKSMGNKKSRVMDSFRHIDADGDGMISRREFCGEIMKSKFRTSKAETERVADLFDHGKDGFVDYYQFVAALHSNKDSHKPQTDEDKIEDEVMRQVAKCTCSKRFQVQKIAENKFRFGDNQQLRLVRILRSTVMVRVGGGWMSLEEFLVKNDPCRAKGRINTELREKFVLPAGATQQMAAFRTRKSGTPRSLQSSSGSSQSTSPSRGSASHDSYSATPTKRNGQGHECGRHPTITRSRHSSGSSGLSTSPSVSSTGATAGDTSPSRPGAVSPVQHSPSRHVPSKGRSSLPRTGLSDAPRRSKIPTTSAPRKKP